jgi:hypothetical protein
MISSFSKSFPRPGFMGADPALWEPVGSPYASAVLAQLERRAVARAAERQPEVVLRPIREDKR